MKRLSALVAGDNIAEIETILILHKQLSGNLHWYASEPYYVECALRDAILTNKTAIVKLFLEVGVSPDAEAYVEGHSGLMYPLIFFALQSQQLINVQLLVEHGLKIKGSLYNPSPVSSWISKPINEGQVDIVEYLLQRDVNVEDFSYDFGTIKITFLAQAAINKDIPMVECLLRHGASVTKAINYAYESLCIKKPHLKNSYRDLLSILLDYAQACNFNEPIFPEYLDVSDFNFSGVSIQGQPITPELLKRYKLLNIEKAIFSLNDLDRLKEKPRKIILLNNLENAYKTQGKLVKKGIVNLIPLYEAAKRGDYDAVQARLNAGVDPNLQTESALLAAAEKGSLEIVKLLVKFHLQQTENKVHQLTEKARAELAVCSQHIYFKAGELNQVPYPCTSQKYFAILPDNNYQNIVTFYQRMGDKHVNIIEKIMNGARLNNENVICITKEKMISPIFYEQIDDEELKDILEKSPIIFTDKNDIKIIEKIIKLQYQMLNNSKTIINDALSRARICKRMLIVKYLETELGINEKNSDGNTLLHEAILENDDIRVEELVKKGADIHLTDAQGRTPIDLAATDFRSFPPKCWVASHNIISFLLTKGAKVGLTTLSASVYSNSPETYALLSAHVSPEQLQELVYAKKRYYPWYKELMFSAIEQKNSIELLILLQNSGANLNQIDKEKGNLIHVATAKGEVTVVEFLIKNKVSLSLRNNEGNTPLHVATESFNIKIVKMLVNAGADISVENNNKLTPLCLLRQIYLAKKKEEAEEVELSKQENRRFLYSSNGAAKEKWAKKLKHFHERKQQLDSDYEEALAILTPGICTVKGYI